MITDIAKTSRPITGGMMNYFHVCHTELWYFSHNVEMEHTSDLMHLGRLVHEESYERDSRQIGRDGYLCADRSGDRYCCVA